MTRLHLLAVLSFHCLLACASAPAATGLPPGSRLIEANGHRLHVRSLGTNQTLPAVVLLSGPTDHWHADSGWFALLQPVLAQQFRVHAIDRAGHGFSDIVAESSYQSFADDLAVLLPKLEQTPVLVIAFASANLSLHHYFAAHGNQGIRAVLLIDPDALHPDLVSFYAEQAAPFQNPEQLAAYVNAGKYDARAQSFYDDERAHLEKLVPAALGKQMDWSFYQVIARQRQHHDRVLARFAETARYDRDVTQAARTPWPLAVPVWSYDTDFEMTAIEAATDPAEKAKLASWRRLGTDWMQALPGHCRLGTTSREHLATVAEADRLTRLVEKLIRSSDCPAQTR